MSTQTQTQATVLTDSGEALSKLATGNIGVQADYAFSNPYSINGPFGTLSLTISAGTSAETAVGQVIINTLWGLGTVTQLSINGPATFNGSTGYTTISAEGHGTITVRPDPPKYITAQLSISLQPGFESGILSVEGFFTGFAIQATSIHYIDGGAATGGN
ncbi:MAG: hypothetical protein ABW019_12610 [Chitinophagaceae bacterium]